MHKSSILIIFCLHHDARQVVFVLSHVFEKDSEWSVGHPVSKLILCVLNTFIFDKY